MPGLAERDAALAGRDKFVAVGAAYERLRAGAAGRVGTRPAVVLLLLQVLRLSVCRVATKQTVLRTTYILLLFTLLQTVDFPDDVMPCMHMRISRPAYR